MIPAPLTFGELRDRLIGAEEYARTFAGLPEPVASVLLDEVQAAGERVRRATAAANRTRPIARHEPPTPELAAIFAGATDQIVLNGRALRTLWECSAVAPEVRA